MLPLANFTQGEYSAIERVLAYDEGIRCQPYQCSAGHWTIGIGHLLPKSFNPQMHWTVEHCYAQLREDIDIAWESAQRLFGEDVLLNIGKARKAAITTLLFNLGYNKLKEQFTETVPALKNKEWNKAANLLLASKWAKDVDPDRRNGVGRDDRVACMLRTGEFPAEYKLGR